VEMADEGITTARPGFKSCDQRFLFFLTAPMLLWLLEQSIVDQRLRSESPQRPGRIDRTDRHILKLEIDQVVATIADRDSRHGEDDIFPAITFGISSLRGSPLTMDLVLPDVCR
jgi:hypothetical protein